VILTKSITNIKERQMKAHTEMSEIKEAKEDYVSEDRSHKHIPDRQRALVLQGGGALGAYEVGVLKVLCTSLPKKQGKNGKDEPLFDIIAGTSMGAMNAAVLVSNVINRQKTWEEAVEQLEIFWTDEEAGLSSTPNFSKWWWNHIYDKNKNTKQIEKGVEEAARKYYSVKEYLKHGTPNVCTPPYPNPNPQRNDDKFRDLPDNLWLHHSSKPLEDTIVRHSTDNNEKLTIATCRDKQQPRLLVVSVDVAEGKTVTFDSYYKEGNGFKNSLYVGDGIGIDHIMASGTLPEFYDYRKIGGRNFCDGGLLSNTPFRELLQAHQDYWLGIIDKDNQKIPDLDVYIVNVHPSKQDPILSGGHDKDKDRINDDHDGVRDRINDITYFDKNSRYDENAVYTELDYSEIIDCLKDLATKYLCINKNDGSTNKIDGFTSDFEKFLTNKAKSKSNANRDRTYKELLRGRFNLIKVERIENTGYEDSISGKGADFTSTSIRDLIAKGKQDALDWLNGTRKDNKN
jgi:NTE family protein